MLLLMKLFYFTVFSILYCNLQGYKVNKKLITIKKFSKYYISGKDFYFSKF